MATTKPKLELTAKIDKEPSGGGGRRFAELAEPSDQVLGRFYLDQVASMKLGNPSQVRVTIEAVDG